MAAKPENTFIRSVHAHLKDVYSEKMNNPFRSGTADVWYSGRKGDLWVEYKYIPAIPKHAQIVPDLSARQLLWLRQRLDEGRRVAVIVGCREGGVLMWDGEWEQGISPSDFSARLLARPALADAIRAITGTSPCRFQQPFSLPQKSPSPRTASSRPA